MTSSAPTTRYLSDPPSRHSCMCVWQVVCQACSANKYYLEYLKNQPARVCDHCFAKLQENSESTRITSGFLLIIWEEHMISVHQLKVLSFSLDQQDTNNKSCFFYSSPRFICCFMGRVISVNINNTDVSRHDSCVFQVTDAPRRPFLPSNLEPSPSPESRRRFLLRWKRQAADSKRTFFSFIFPAVCVWHERPVFNRCPPTQRTPPWAAT